MSDLTYQSSMLCERYHAAPAFQTIAKGARHMPQYIKESCVSGGAFGPLADERISRSGMHEGTFTNATTLSPQYSNQHITFFTYEKKAGKSVPLQAWTGLEGSRKFRFPDFMTTAQDGGQPCAPTGFTPQEILLVLISVRG